MGFDQISVVKGFGLGMLEERLDLYYSENYEIKIESINGTNIKINLPLN